MPEQDVKVIAIIGRGRSGSTILDNLLGELDGFFSAGQLHNLWKRMHMGFTCGCGKPVAECDLWSSVNAASLEDPIRGRIDPSQVVKWQAEVVRLRYGRRLSKASEGDSAWPALNGYAGVLSRVYQSLARLTGARVIVDSSKRPAVGALLRALSGVSPYVVHLVRDPRAVSYSYKRIKTTVDREMKREGAIENSLRYVYRNLASHAVRRGYESDHSMLLRYEDFVTKPIETLRRITHLVGESPADFPVDGDGMVTLSPNHTAGGNPSRFKTGRVALRLDDEWVVRQRLSDRLTTTSVTLPLLRGYGYPIVPRRRPPDPARLQDG
ncbi:MAG: sulfotransferase [Actinobacteria bacterium]|nr:sulfotransferase [Actinomycetota bacterium]